MDLVDGIAVRRVSKTESVDGKGAVAIFERDIRVAVLVVVVREVPVAAKLSVYIADTGLKYIRLVKSNTVS